MRNAGSRSIYPFKCNEGFNMMEMRRRIEVINLKVCIHSLRAAPICGTS